MMEENQQTVQRLYDLNYTAMKILFKEFLSDKDIIPSNEFATKMKLLAKLSLYEIKNILDCNEIKQWDIVTFNGLHSNKGAEYVIVTNINTIGGSIDVVDAQCMLHTFPFPNQNIRKTNLKIDFPATMRNALIKELEKSDVCKEY